MNHAETSPREAQMATYLQTMRALRSEMLVAMECIAGNAWPRFQKSVATQEELCAELVALSAAVRGSWMADADAAIGLQMRQAGTLLCQANMEYAALLRHSGKTLALLSSLCSTYTGRPQEARGARSKYQTWSCEM